MDHVHINTIAFARPLPPMAKQSRNPASLNGIAERLRLTREASGMIQAQFCRIVGIGQQAWNNYERGERRISIDQALQLCSALGVTLDWIYRGIASGLPIQLAEEIRRIERTERPTRRLSA
jgi:transcriptional regulator with XRE-family HTH domain